MKLTIGWCEYDKGGRLYQASVSAFPSILGVGRTRAAAIEHLNLLLEEAGRAAGQYNLWTCH